MFESCFKFVNFAEYISFIQSLSVNSHVIEMTVYFGFFLWVLWFFICGWIGVPKEMAHRFSVTYMRQTRYVCVMFCYVVWNLCCVGNQREKFRPSLLRPPASQWRNRSFLVFPAGEESPKPMKPMTMIHDHPQKGFELSKVRSPKSEGKFV